MTTIFQDGINQIFDILNEYAVLETITYTTSDGFITGESSAKATLQAVVQPLSGEEYSQMNAGNIPQSTKKVYIKKDNNLEPGTFSDTDSKKFYIYYPTDGTTSVTGAAKFEITAVPGEWGAAEETPDARSDANKAYTKAYLKELI